MCSSHKYSKRKCFWKALRPFECITIKKTGKILKWTGYVRVCVGERWGNTTYMLPNQYSSVNIWELMRLVWEGIGWCLLRLCGSLTGLFAHIKCKQQRADNSSTFTVTVMFSRPKHKIDGRGMICFTLESNKSVNLLLGKETGCFFSELQGRALYDIIYRETLGIGQSLCLLQWINVCLRLASWERKKKAAALVIRSDSWKQLCLYSVPKQKVAWLLY